MDHHSQPNELPQVVPEEAIASTASEEFNRELKREKREKWIRRSLITAAVSATFAALLAGGYTIWRINNSAPVVVNTDQTTQKQQSTTFYYAVQTTAQTPADRTWPTYTINQKSAGETAEKELFKVGAQGQYPVDIVADKTGKYLAVNYESKLTVYTLADGKEKATIPAGTGLNFSRPVFSPKSDKLFAFEITGPTNNKPASLFATTIDLATEQQSREVMAADMPAMSSDTWSKDDTIVASFISSSEFTRPYSFDIKENKAIALSENVERYITSEDGTTIAITTDLIANAANCFSGQSPSGFKIIRTSDAKEVGAFVAAGTVLSPLRFSLDNASILASYSQPVAGTDCPSDPVLDSKTAVISWANQTKEDVTSDQQDQKGFPKRLEVTTERTGTGAQYILKFGADTVRSSDVKNPIIPLVTISA